MTTINLSKLESYKSFQMRANALAVQSPDDIMGLLVGNAPTKKGEVYKENWSLKKLVEENGLPSEVSAVRALYRAFGLLDTENFALLYTEEDGTTHPNNVWSPMAMLNKKGQFGLFIGFRFFPFDIKVATVNGQNFLQFFINGYVGDVPTDVRLSTQIINVQTFDGTVNRLQILFDYTGEGDMIAFPVLLHPDHKNSEALPRAVQNGNLKQFQNALATVAVTKLEELKKDTIDLNQLFRPLFESGKFKEVAIIMKGYEFIPASDKNLYPKYRLEIIPDNLVKIFGNYEVSCYNGELIPVSQVRYVTMSPRTNPARVLSPNSSSAGIIRVIGPNTKDVKFIPNMSITLAHQLSEQVKLALFGTSIALPVSAPPSNNMQAVETIEVTEEELGLE